MPSDPGGDTRVGDGRRMLGKKSSTLQASECNPQVPKRQASAGGMPAACLRGEVQVGDTG